MAPCFWSLLLCLPGLGASAPWASSCNHRDESAPAPPPPNANHIFNAIHSSMRQWGSSLNHNGMSFFLASVPEGTLFYHGTYTDGDIEGPEWLAFEPEHAMAFARGPGGPGRPPGRGKPPGRGGPPPGHPDFDEPPPPPIRSPPRNKGNSQEPLSSSWESTEDRDGNGSPDEPSSPDNGTKRGWLHTYRTKHDLSLLYLDGESAAKSSKGTLDTQNYILAPQTDSPDDRPGFGEYQRAKDLCQKAKDVWGGHIDGILRMEEGFEIILCSFEKHLDVMNKNRVMSSSRGPRDGMGFDMYKAIAARFRGIGGERVKLNYDNFVSVFAYSDMDLFKTGTMPRLEHLPAKQLKRIEKDVDDLAKKGSKTQDSVNWQTVVDMIVERYSDRLLYWATGDLSQSELQSELYTTLRPFVDYDARNTTLEIERCTKQFWPSGTDSSSTLAARAVSSVYNSICSTLVAAAAEKKHIVALASIRHLNEYLAWTTWKQCRGCAYNEVCSIPIWPHGTVEDFENPKCRNSSNFNDEDGTGYWGGFRHH